MNELDIKIKQSIRLIKTLDGLEPELCYSGGKDSDVILTLAQMSGINFHPIYKMTTIDPPGTLAHVKLKGVEIVKPKTTFFHLIEKRGFPSRFARFCCSELKEYKILDKSILGIRRDESISRNRRYKEPSACRIYKDKSRVEQFFPILYWTDKDVEEFVNYYGIECHKLYYDENGKFIPSRRLGCLGCPLSSKRGINDFLKYPKLVRQWIKAGKIWFESKDNLKVKNYVSDIYELFVLRTFYDSISEMCLNKESLFQADWKALLEEYFKIDLP